MSSEHRPGCAGSRNRRFNSGDLGRILLDHSFQDDVIDTEIVTKGMRVFPHADKGQRMAPYSFTMPSAQSRAT